MTKHVLSVGLLVLSALPVYVRKADARPASASETAKPQRKVDLLEHPTGGKTPVEVSIGLFLTNLVSIDETRESFEAGGYLQAKWKDARLAVPASAETHAGETPAPAHLRTVKPEEIWMPAIQATNTITHKTNGYEVEVDADGVVTYTERFDVTLSNEYSLRKFPFDTQVLRFDLEPFRSSTSAITFAPQALAMTGTSTGRNTELASWRIDGLRYVTGESSKRDATPGIRESAFELTIARRPAFYVWKIFLPLMMISLIPAVVFWIDAKEFDWLLKIPMTMLLSMVAFELAITRDLPRVGYVTFLDAVFVTGFTLCFLSILEILIVYLIHKRGAPQRAARIHAAGRWLYPLTYFGVLALLALFFLL